MRTGDLEEFRGFAEARLPHLRRTAYLMCGDWHHAEDITQTALTKLYAVWGGRRRIRNLEAYAHRVLTRACVDHMRRRWRREQPASELPDRAEHAADQALGLQVRAALEELPPRQRAVVVLRYWADLDIPATAAALGCTSGTVKSHTARALARLRCLLGDEKGSEVFGEPAASAQPADQTRQTRRKATIR
ncbi:SigE family RNA polymerase sigma factor [Streptomyces sp. NPDC004520]|uniref:SigE family RNA polymerase sigma factor n=1 Tax=Streptomyces sp. NPDC004520 TaxID=3364702 RepID=UPI00369DD1CD